MSLPRVEFQKAGEGRVGAILKKAASEEEFNTIKVAVAFASVAGVAELLDTILAKRLPATSYWLFGLDNFITHPDAIKRVMKMQGAQVRVVSGERGVWIFHPKLYWFSNGDSTSSLVMGSANLTAGGLGGNVEAVTLLKVGSEVDSAALDGLWRAAWKSGRKITERKLEEYRQDFESARKARKKAGLLVDKRTGGSRKKNEPVLSSDDARVDPSLAQVCWIEVGNITGFKQDQLEIKGEQLPFFSMPRHGGKNTEFKFKLTSGGRVVVPLRYFPKNDMWRFLLPQSIPEVKAGLRVRRSGKLLRSSYVAVFSRKGKAVELKFIRLRSSEFKALRKATERAGTLGRTTSRAYGWL